MVVQAWFLKRQLLFADLDDEELLRR